MGNKAPETDYRKTVRQGRLTTMPSENRLAAMFNIVSCVAASLILLLTYFLAKQFEAQTWFALILSVANATIAFCAARIAFDESSFDDSGSPAYVMMAGVLAFIGIVLTYVTLGVYPLGENSVMIVDMHHQYACFFSMMRDKIVEGKSLFYNESAGLGSCYLPLFAYYLSSPFNILMLIFPRELLTEAIALVTILKVTAAGVTFAVMVKGLLRRNDFSVVCGGVMYSMISFLIVHSWNIMWLDPIILLPLIVLGLDRLLRDGKPALYCITLAMAIITNYYIAYMICIFLVLYYIAHVICESKGYTLSMQVTKFWRFCYGSLIGGGISMALLLPTAIYLGQTSGAEDSFARDLESNFDLFELFQRLMFAPTPSIRGMSLPNVYCSVLAVFLLALFLCCKKIPARKRITWGALTGFVILSMSVNWLNFAWHGFHFPNDLPYRQSFVLSFVLVYIAMQVLDKLESVSVRGVAVSWGILAAVIFYEERYGDSAMDFRTVYVSLVFLSIYAVIALLCSTKKLKKTLCYTLLLLFVFTEVTANASVNIRMLDDNEGGVGKANAEYFTLRDNYTRDYAVNSAAVDVVEGYDEPEYRMELKRGSGTCNDPSLFNYSGITVFASSNPKATTTFMGKLGFAVNGVNSHLFRNYVPAVDSLLGIKYLVTETMDKDADNGSAASLNYINTVYDSEGTTRYVYQNSNALPKLFAVNSTIKNLDLEQYGGYPNPFEVQNELYRLMAGVDGVYKMNSDLFVSVGSDYASVYGNYFSYNGYGTAFTATYTTVEEGSVYAYIDCRAAETVSIMVDGEWVASPSANEPYIVSCGRIGAGVNIDVSVGADGSCGGYIYLATLDEANFTTAINHLKSGAMTFDEYSEDTIKGSVTVGQDGVMFTSIPYDSGWSVLVDGKEVKTYSLGDALLCFEIGAGEHTVELRYIPNGFIPGVVISVISIIALVLLIRPDWAKAIASPFVRLFSKKKKNTSAVVDQSDLPADFFDKDDFEEIDIDDLFDDSEETTE
ncbi:MAG: YfhO family protein [Clostridia bacterium]|nr:YfhO family protein [Clostridia bacterium]